MEKLPEVACELESLTPSVVTVMFEETQLTPNVIEPATPCVSILSRPVFLEVEPVTRRRSYRELPFRPERCYNCPEWYFLMATMISSQNEQMLKQAVSSGRFKDQDEALAEALRLLCEQTANGSVEAPILPPDKWVKEFDRITASRQGGNPRMDDSRESIYGDRGL